MKKIFGYLFVCLWLTVLPLSLAGCGKAKEKVEVDGDTVKIQGPDGEEAIISEGGWPDSELAKELPEFEKGNIISTVAAEDTVIVYLEKVEAEDFNAYLEEIKEIYSENSYETESEEAILYGGSGAGQISVILQYAKEEQTMSITAAGNEE
jgi:hypothetical protein